MLIIIADTNERVGEEVQVRYIIFFTEFILLRKPKKAWPRLVKLLHMHTYFVL